VKRIQATVIAGLLLLMLILPQLTLAAGPGISNVVVLDCTSTTATIFWTTNTTSDSRVNYGTTTPLSKHVDKTEDVTHHYIILEVLEPDTKYFFAVESNGERSPADPSEYYSFTTLAPTEYRITLDNACGVCGELVIEPDGKRRCGEVIEVTAVVAAEGDYRICWDSRKSGNVKGTFHAAAAGIYTLAFYMPEAKKGIHNVYLTNTFYDDLGTNAVAEFEVFPSVKIEEVDSEDKDPMKGPVGTEVTINGYGFKASQDIRVSFEGTVIKTDKADTVGSWDVPYTIPATPGGASTFEVEAEESSGVWVCWVSKYFTVTPKITVTPSSGTVGQAIEISGTGFKGEEEGIEVTFDGEVVKPITYPDVDEHGSWSAVIPVPPLQGGGYPIGASGESTRARDVEGIEGFTVSPGVWVEPPGLAYYVGDTITVAGGGFEPGETGIDVYFEGQVVAADITAEIDGCWETSFVLPASTYGENTVWALGDVTARVETTLTAKAKIESISPEEGAPGDSVTLSGSGFSGSKNLTVTVGGVAASGSMQTQSNGNVNITFRVPKGSAEGKQKVVVTDEGGVTATAPVDFTVKEKIISTTPLPISPKDSTLRSGEVTFRWQGVTGNTGYTYTLEISKTAGSGNIWSKSGIEESSYTLTKTESVDEALEKGTYYWRVKIVDDYGNESAWSDSVEFTVSPIPTWVWVVVGVVVLVVLMVVAYRETKFKVTK